MITTVERALLLADVELFQSVPSEVLAKLGAAGREDRFAAEEVIYRVGELGDALHVVGDGRVRLERAERKAVVLGPGQAFGEWALLESQPRLFTATASEPSRVLTVERHVFVDVLADNVALCEGILAVLATRVRHAIRDAIRDADDSAVDREVSLG